MEGMVSSSDLVTSWTSNSKKQIICRNNTEHITGMSVLMEKSKLQLTIGCIISSSILLRSNHWRVTYMHDIDIEEVHKYVQ